MVTLNASQVGLAQIKQARKERGWTIEDPRWLVAASRLIDPTRSWDITDDPFAVSEATWKRFLAGKRVETPTFKAFCQILDLKWEEVVDRPMPARSAPLLDWNVAPDIRVFYGRADELAMLADWMATDQASGDLMTQGCRLITIWGMGGIGKTALTVKLVEQMQHQADGVIWRSLRSTPPLDTLLTDVLQQLTPESRLPDRTDDLVSMLLQQFYQRRYLFVLDGWENILGGDRAGRTQPGYTAYGELLRRIGSERHQSSVIITSREKPEEITWLESNAFPVRSLKLAGLGRSAEKILHAKGLEEEPNHWATLIQTYRGNPLALNVVATLIKEFFNGRVSEVLRTQTLIGLVEVEDVIAERVRHLTALEHEILCCLARAHHPLDRHTLRSQLTPQIPYSDFLEALFSLERRSLLENSSEPTQVLFSLQPLVMKYITRRFLSTNH